MSAHGFHERWFILYALVLGILGVLALAYLFVYQTTAVDLFTLLLFTVTAVIVSSFQVPIYRTAARSLLRRSSTLAALGDVELGMEGAILLGFMLAAGPSLGAVLARGLDSTDVTSPVMNATQPPSEGPAASMTPSRMAPSMPSSTSPNAARVEDLRSRDWAAVR